MTAKAALDAWHNLKLLAPKVRPIFDLVEELKEYASVESAIEDGQRRLAELQEKEKDILAAIVKQKDKWESELAEHKSRGDALINECINEGNERLQSATAKAQHKIDEATAQAHEIVAEAERLAAAHASKRDDIAAMDKVLDTAKVDHAEWLDRIEQSKTEHERIQQLIADLKAKVLA